MAYTKNRNNCIEYIFDYHLISILDNNGNVDLIEYLLDSGADLNARTKWGDAPIHYAACFTSYEAFKFLLEEGADLERNEIRKLKSYMFNNLIMIQ